MVSDRVDLVIFGASGHTGKCVVRELPGIAKKYPGLTWAVAGRSRNKLRTLLQDVSIEIGDDLSSIKIIEAEVGNAKSLKHMCEQTKLILNCCGPYLKYGQLIVGIAIECKTHYIDISAEKRFIGWLEQRYDKLAREADVYVVTACGLVSVPADLGVLYLQENFNGTLNSVESYCSLDIPSKMRTEKDGVIRYSSWESLINSVAETPFNETPSIISQLKPKLKQRWVLHKRQGNWYLPVPYTDTQVVKNTQLNLFLNESIRPVQYQSYLKCGSFLIALGLLIYSVFLYAFCKVPSMRKFLLAYPKLCTFGRVTRDGPKEELMEGMCMQYEMVGRGWEKWVNVENNPPKKQVVGRVTVSGRKPVYPRTAVIAIFCAIAILKERDAMPQKGGVMTPGVAFRRTNLIKNLQKHDIIFEIVSEIN